MSNKSIQGTIQKESRKFRAKYLFATTDKLYLSEIIDEHGNFAFYCHFIDIKKIFDELKDFLKTLELDNNIEFIGFQSDLINEGFQINNSQDIRKV